MDILFYTQTVFEPRCLYFGFWRSNSFVSDAYFYSKRFHRRRYIFILHRVAGNVFYSGDQNKLKHWMAPYLMTNAKKNIYIYICLCITLWQIIQIITFIYQRWCDESVRSHFVSITRWTMKSDKKKTRKKLVVFIQSLNIFRIIFIKKDQARTRRKKRTEELRWNEINTKILF